jgi:transformation/transcription domain-associated protein
MQLTLPQISQIITAYSKNLQDVNIPPQIQTMCVKLLLGLADNLVQQPSKLEGK